MFTSSRIDERDQEREFINFLEVNFLEISLLLYLSFRDEIFEEPLWQLDLDRDLFLLSLGR